ncbi:MAG: dipeptidase [Pyrinomonadaceae bacterium MAG19_C2-C3]|nr:dipeptidase [Pyrinomonadaceae bacterium MAG19_C2-C3]
MNSQTADIATRIHERHIVIDMHADTAQRLVDEDVNLNHELADGHFDRVRMQRGGVAAQFFAVWVNPHYYGTGGATAIARADIQIAAVHRLVENHPRVWTLATCAADVRQAKTQGKCAALLGLEGGYAIDNNFANIERYFKMGVRYMSATWTHSTDWAGTSHDGTGRGRGLNSFGKDVTREMNRLGMMVDVSHVSDKTFWDTIAASRKPVIASHSNARALARVRRNLSDDMIRAIANANGVACVVFYPAFLDDKWNALKEAVQAETETLQALKLARETHSDDAVRERLALERVYEAAYKRLPQVPVSRVIDHIEHIVNLVGINHVGLGSDFDGIQATPRDLESIADYPNITRELLRRGFAEDDIARVLGGNVLRVMEDSERD